MTKPKEAEVRLKRKRDYNREWMREYQRKNPLTEEQKRLKREYAKNHYYKNKKRLNKQSSDYMKSPRGKEINKKRRLNNLEKHKCRDFINHAIRDGKIEKFPFRDEAGDRQRILRRGSCPAREAQSAGATILNNS